MARQTTAGRRYAEAAFELAQRDGSLDAWQRDLSLAAATVADERVAAIVDNPAVPHAERDRLVSNLLGDHISRPTLNLVRLLVQRGKVDLLAQVAREYDRLLREQRGIVEAVVTTPVPLSDGETIAIRDRLAAVTGSEVQLRSELDPALIGGLTVRVGDRLLDASVRGRLDRLRDQLIVGNR
jgi:F-type H+-transporting ATPase subunit delta